MNWIEKIPFVPAVAAEENFIFSSWYAPVVQVGMEAGKISRYQSEFDCFTFAGGEQTVFFFLLYFGCFAPGGFFCLIDCDKKS